MMTQKDYIKIAQVLKTCNQTISSKASASYTLETVTRRIANMLQADSPRFDRDKFADAVYR